MYRIYDLAGLVLLLSSLSLFIRTTCAFSLFDGDFSLFSDGSSTLPKAETFHSLGSLGLPAAGTSNLKSILFGNEGEEVARVVAWEDFNHDRYTDALLYFPATETVQVYLWNPKSSSFVVQSMNHAGPNQRTKAQQNDAGVDAVVVNPHAKILDLLVSDFNGDGHPDLILICEDEQKAGGKLVKFYAGLHTGISADVIDLPLLSKESPVAYGDILGEGHPSLIGYSAADASSLSAWTFASPQALPQRISLPLTGGTPCTLAPDHPIAFVDFDGDCLADLFFVCKPRAPASHKSYQIWTRTSGDDVPNYLLAQEGALPEGVGAFSFADINRDGTVDVVFPSCSRQDAQQNLVFGKDCTINVAYNIQMPLCKDAASFSSTSKKDVHCRSVSNLCVADAQFQLDLSSKSSTMNQMKLNDILPGVSELLLTSYGHHQPIYIGDVNLDGSPDLLLVAKNEAGQSRAHILLSEKVTKDDSKVENRRSFVEAVGHHVEVLQDINDVHGASFFDIGEDGSLDILVQHRADKSGQQFTFARNNAFRDAFFLKTSTLNRPVRGKQEPGSHVSGVSYKYIIYDNSGNRHASELQQKPQTSGFTLGLPFGHTGLGYTTNYIETLSVGSLHGPDPIYALEGVMPNSHIVLSPSPIKGGRWEKALYLRPGNWALAIAIMVAITTVLLGGVVLYLGGKERQADEAERRQAMHHFL